MDAFPGEKVLAASLPDYQSARSRLWIELCALLSLFVPLVLSFCVKKERRSAKTSTTVSAAARPSGTSTTTTTVSTTRKVVTTRRVVKRSQSFRSGDDSVYSIRPLRLIFASSSFICVLVAVLLLRSPDNYHTPRGVFQAPALTREECQEILGMADRAAGRNYEEAKARQPRDDEITSKKIDGLLTEPVGWQKSRHDIYVTTDLNIVTDPFTLEDRAYIRSKLDSRLAPVIERIFGIPGASIRANDMFVVRYDAGRRESLTNHTDDSSISFNILLDDGFEGGGTKFWDRRNGRPFAHVQPDEVGQVLVHSSLIHHEGVHISSGTRTILVGFLSVDRVDPWTLQPTGLPWLASWGSLPWLANKLREAWQAGDARDIRLWRDAPWFRSILLRAFDSCMLLGDYFLPHFVSNLVLTEHRQEYIDALDAAYSKRQSSNAIWFAGQQIDIDFNGKVVAPWNTRTENLHRFVESEL